MMIEVKVDVHAVHPTSATPTLFPKSVSAGGAYGSWCTPESTPDHKILTKAHSLNIDCKAQNQTNFREKEFIPQPKVRLFSSNSYTECKLGEKTNEHCIELEELKKTTDGEELQKGSSPIKENELPVIETPQSPIPSSPRAKRHKIFNRLPTFCDPFICIDPQGRGYISWLFLVTACYSYNSWCIPLRATFPYQTPDNTPFWLVADYLCDIVYWLDTAFVKPRLMYLHEGFWVNDASETRKNYRKKSQYKFDVLSLLPLDLLYIYFGTSATILRFPRLLKLQTFWEFHRAVDRVLASPYVVRVGKTLFYIFYLIHLNACAYYAMSAYTGLASNGWVYDNEGNAYIRCFYFATKTATSIGKNPKPETTAEYLFMTAAWLMGVFVFALLIGQIRDIYSTATRARTEYRKRLDSSSWFMRRLNMPTPLKRRVASYFNYTWQTQKCFDEARIMNSLPFNMKRDVALEVHMSTLSKVQLFRDCSDTLLRDLVLQLKPECFLPGDIVVRRGDVGHNMYIIQSGECCVMSQDGKECLAKLKEGCVFGEISLLGIDGLRHRTATVVSRGFSNLFVLSRQDLEVALKHHKEAARILRLRADQIIRENAARQAMKKIVDRQIRKSVSIQEEPSDILRQRRPSSLSTSSGQAAEGKRQRSASAVSKRKLSTVSENKVQENFNQERPSLASACQGVRQPLPTIVFSSN